MRVVLEEFDRGFSSIILISISKAGVIALSVLSVTDSYLAPWFDRRK